MRRHHLHKSAGGFSPVPKDPSSASPQDCNRHPSRRTEALVGRTWVVIGGEGESGKGQWIVQTGRRHGEGVGGGPSCDRCGGGQWLSFASRIWQPGPVAATISNRRSLLAFDGGVPCQPESPPVVRVNQSMGVCWFSHHLHSSLGSCVRWVCAVPALTSTRPSPLAFDESVPCQPPPPPVLRFWRSIGPCHASAHLHPSFAFGVRWVYAVPALTSTRRHLSFGSSARWVCAVPTLTSTRPPLLAFDGSMPCQRSPPPVVTRRLGLALDGSAPYRPSPPPVLRFWRSMGLCRASAHLHPSFASGVRLACTVLATPLIVSVMRLMGSC